MALRRLTMRSNSSALTDSSARSMLGWPSGVSGERGLGWLVHYLVGIAFAGVLGGLRSRAKRWAC